MNRLRCKELLPIIEAFANGEDIQGGPIDLDHWQSIDSDAFFDDETQRFRIKPTPREWWIRLGKEGQILSTASHSMEERPGTTTTIKVREVL